NGAGGVGADEVAGDRVVVDIVAGEQDAVAGIAEDDVAGDFGEGDRTGLLLGSDAGEFHAIGAVAGARRGQAGGIAADEVAGHQVEAGVEAGAIVLDEDAVASVAADQVAFARAVGRKRGGATNDVGSEDGAAAVEAAGVEDVDAVVEPGVAGASIR